MSATTQLKAYRFSDARKDGEVVDKGGYHQPQTTGRGIGHGRGCGCSLTTDKGAYRDVTVEMPGGATVHYYHQSPVVVTDGSRYRLDSCGYQTSTTKERINRYTPAGYTVIQRDFTWYVDTPDGDRIEFEDGMVIET